MKKILFALVMGFSLHAAADGVVGLDNAWEHPLRSGVDMSPLEKCVGGDENRRTMCLDKHGFGISQNQQYPADAAEARKLKKAIEQCVHSENKTYKECSSEVKANTTASNGSPSETRKAVDQCVKAGGKRQDCQDMIKANSTAQLDGASSVPMQSASLSTSVVH